MKRMLSLMFVIPILTVTLFGYSVNVDATNAALDKNGFDLSDDDSQATEFYDIYNINQERIDDVVNSVMDKSKVPGISIAIVSDHQTKYLSYGYADLENQIRTNENTLYELGSMSKAFTALGLLLLEDQGVVNLDDNISQYIPGFYAYFKGYHEGRKYDGNVDITIRQVLYQTSGIPYKTIGGIPEGSSNSKLKETVEGLYGVRLDFYPGEKYQYATVNYDIIGYIIEIVSGKTFEEYITNNILIPLGMCDTFLFREDALLSERMSKGYKIEYFKAREYNAPVYRGNTPAGYIISNASQMERWMRIQLGLVEIPDDLRRVIVNSHLGDMTVASHGEYYYAGGWNVRVNYESLWHGGANPNYSSFIILQPEERFGICILSNMNSNAASFLSDNILNIIQARKEISYSIDNYQILDIVFSWVIMISIILLFVYVALMIKAVRECKKHTRTVVFNKKNIVEILSGIVVIIAMGFCIYYIPNIMMERLPWRAVLVWGSQTIALGCILGFVSVALFLIYTIFTFTFPKDKEKGYLALVPLNLVNGIVSSLTIFIINETFNRNLEFSGELLIYFLFTLLFFIYTMKLLQTKMITITNENSYEKKIELMEKVINSSFQGVEKIGKERIFSGLNNDTAAIAQLPIVIIGFVTNLVTIIFCLSYIFVKSKATFFISITTIGFNCIIAAYISKVATAYWEKNRDIQDRHFGLMSDLVNGFKELVLNSSRRIAFSSDLKISAKRASELSKTASIKFMHFDLFKSIIFNMIFGVVVFILPIIVDDIDANILRENLFIVFYVIGPFTTLANIIPQLTQINIHRQRIDDLINDLDIYSSNRIDSDDNPSYDKIKIDFEHIIFKYSDQDCSNDNKFELGPLNITVESGTLTFITGGNGSGKSTLGKIITGLYQPSCGIIKINDKISSSNELNELFSSVFSDYNLFKKLYGIEYKNKSDTIQHYLDMMQLTDNVKLREDEFDSINLSTGQKKRLAFFIACLEEKRMMILDEWAAEQDPQFRHYFYNDLLHMLKKKGIGVIVITHDDRYFGLADKIYKLEHGKLI